MNLRSAELQAIDVWLQSRATSPQLSLPHIVEPKAAYFQQAVRVMIVGQATFGWGAGVDPHGTPDAIVDQLLRCYSDFDLGATYRRTPFWDAANQIFHSLNPTALERAFVWSNLVKFDNRRQRVSPELEAAIASIPLLPTEVSTFAPDVVVFFTGPRYEARLRTTFAGARVQEVGSNIGCIVHPALPQRSYRTYHPAYLRRARRWSVIDELVSLCKVT